MKRGISSNITYLKIKHSVLCCCRVNKGVARASLSRYFYLEVIIIDVVVIVIAAVALLTTLAINYVSPRNNKEIHN